MKKQIHIVYTGRVQGVGFRYTTEEIANNLGILGWVKNLRNGQVEVVAQGEEEILNTFLQEIKDHFSGYIKNIDIQYEEIIEVFSEFIIKF